MSKLHIFLVFIVLSCFLSKGLMCEYIERMTKRQIHERISSIDRVPKVTCQLSEAGYLKILIDPSSVPKAVAWVLPKSFYSGEWILGNAAIYTCQNGEMFYRFETMMPWLSWAAGKMKEKMTTWTLEDGSLAIRPEEMVWIEEMMKSLGTWLWPKTEIILHHRPSETPGDMNTRIRMRISGAITYDNYIPKDQFERNVVIFKQNCFIKTI